MLQHTIERIWIVKDFGLRAGLDLVIDVGKWQLQMGGINRGQARTLPTKFRREVGRQVPKLRRKIRVNEQDMHDEANPPLAGYSAGSLGRCHFAAAKSAE